MVAEPVDSATHHTSTHWTTWLPTSEKAWPIQMVTKWMLPFGWACSVDFTCDRLRQVALTIRTEPGVSLPRGCICSHGLSSRVYNRALIMSNRMLILGIVPVRSVLPAECSSGVWHEHEPPFAVETPYARRVGPVSTTGGRDAGRWRLVLRSGLAIQGIVSEVQHRPCEAGQDPVDTSSSSQARGLGA